MLHTTMIQMRRHMQIFKACTFFVNHCIWQALHKARTHTASHKKGLVLKPWNHMRTCRAFTNHETTAQSTRKHESLKNSWHSVHRICSNSQEKREKCRTWCWRLLECIFLRYSAFSCPIGTSLPHTQHIRDSWCFVWDFSTPKTLIQQNWAERPSKSEFHCLHQPKVSLAQAWVF
jgi:hypothetical protein